MDELLWMGYDLQLADELDPNRKARIRVSLKTYGWIQRILIESIIPLKSVDPNQPFLIHPKIASYDSIRSMSLDHVSADKVF